MSIDTEYMAVTAKEIPTGIHRARIVSAKKDKSQKNNDMIVLELELYGFSRRIKTYIVFLPDRPQMAGIKLQELFDSFPRTADSMDTQDWAGAIGAVEISHEEYNGNMTVKVAHFIPETMQYNLPDFDKGVVIYEDVEYIPRDPAISAMCAKSFQEMLQDISMADAGVMQYA